MYLCRLAAASAPLNVLGAKRCENKKHLTHQQFAADSIRPTPLRTENCEEKGLNLMEKRTFVREWKVASRAMQSRKIETFNEI